MKSSGVWGASYRRPVFLCSVATAEVLADAPIRRGGTWNADGDIVFAATSTTGLMRVSAAGGAPAPVTKLASGQSIHAWPQFLPPGRRFLFTVAGDPDARGVYVASLDGGEARRALAI